MPAATVDQVRAIEALPWVADGVNDSRESATYQTLRELAAASRDVFWELMRKPWMRSESLLINGVDLLIFAPHINAMVHGSEKTTLAIVRMPFLQTLEPDDYFTLSILRNLLSTDPEGVAEMLSHPQLDGGITDDNSVALAPLYLQQEYPEAAEAIRALPWRDDQPENIKPLLALALGSRPVFWAWMERFGNDNIDGSIAERIVTIAGRNESAAIQVLRMPFLETFEFHDFEVVRLLSDLAGSDPHYVERILAHPSLRDGITDDNASAVQLLYLELVDPEAAAALRALPWVADALKATIGSGTESSIWDSPDREAMGILYVLVELHSRGEQQILFALTSKSWFKDGISLLEVSAIDNLLRIGSDDSSAAAHVLGMPFLEDFTPDDAKILEALVRVRKWGKLPDILTHRSLKGGITDDGKGVFALAQLELQEPEAGKSIESLPWVVDGLGASEQDSVWALYTLALDAQQVFWAVMERSWVQDSLTEYETSAIYTLAAMGSMSNTASNPTAALRIVEMPFMESIEAADAAAVDSLWQLAFVHGQDLLSPTLSHPALSAGITDDQVTVVSVLSTAVERTPTLLQVLLDPGQVNVEERTITLPLAGEVDLAVISVRPDAFRTLELLEHAVRHHETLMATPWPKSYVALLVADIGGGGGGGPSGILTLDSGYEDLAELIAHEAAHVYWAFAPRWLQEGPAVFFERASESSRAGAPLEGYDTSCQESDNLAFLDRQRLDDSYCHYKLGWGMFYDLYDSLSEERFRHGLRKLYLTLKSETLTSDSACTGIGRGECSVKAAFIDVADPELAAVVNDVVDRWYYGSEDGR